MAEQSNTIYIIFQSILLENILLFSLIKMINIAIAHKYGML